MELSGNDSSICVTGKTAEQVADEFQGKGYGDFKVAVGEAVIETLRPIQKRFADSWQRLCSALWVPATS